MNLKEIKELVRLIDSSNLSEFQLEMEDVKVHIKKENIVKVVRDEKAVALNKEDYIVNAQPAENNKVTESKKEEENLHIIKSPIVGIYYGSPKPDAPAYVKVGDRIKAGDVLCIVEAMKLMNEIVSDVDGEIVEILAGNQSPVEYGQPLFKVRKV